MVDAYFNALARRRKAEQFEQERKAKAFESRVASIRAEMANGPKVVYLDGPIGQDEGEYSAAWLRSQLPTDGRELVLKIHSEGGSVFESFAMFDLLAGYRGPKRCEVASMAFSAASLLPCCFDDSAITGRGYMMIHAPRYDRDDITPGEVELLDKLRSEMVDIYCQRTGKPESVIRRLLDEEAYFDAEASVEFGLVHRVASSTVIAKKIPARIIARLKPSTSATALWKAAVASAGDIMKADRQNPGLRLKMITEANKR